MKFKRNFLYFTCVLGTATALSVSSCSKNDDIINEEFEDFDSSNKDLNQETIEVSFPAALIGNLGESEEDLRKSFTNIVDPQKAKIIVIDSRSINDNDEILLNAYNRDAIIVVLNPDGKVVEEWSDNHDIFYAGPEENESCSAYGFNGRGIYYSARNRIVIDDDDVPLFHLCSWVNEVCSKRYSAADIRSKDIQKRFTPQSITHTFPIKVDEKKVVDGHWAPAGQLALNTTASVTYQIYPIHAYDGNSTGDYYAVEAEMVLHNAPMNNGTWSRRRGEEIMQLSGFYLNRCEVTANLLRKSNGQFVESTSHQFADGASPRPASTMDAATYDPGFNWNLPATVTGGIPDNKDCYKLTAFNDWTWNNSNSIELPGVAIQNIEDASNVKYTLAINGLPGATDNLVVTAVPDLATGDLTFKYSWIWYVPDMDENSTDKLYMQVGVNPVYQAYQWITDGKMTLEEFENAVPESVSLFRFRLTPPNRVATGSAIIRNTSQDSYYIRDIKLWRNKTTDMEPDVVVPQTISTTTATGGSGVNATMLMLPVGDYTVQGLRYSMKDGQSVDEHIIVNTTPISVSMGGNLTIDFGADIFTVK